jgi:hypothetical protein
MFSSRRAINYYKNLFGPHRSNLRAASWNPCPRDTENPFVVSSRDSRPQAQFALSLVCKGKRDIPGSEVARLYCTEMFTCHIHIRPSLARHIRVVIIPF